VFNYLLYDDEPEPKERFEIPKTYIEFEEIEKTEKEQEEEREARARSKQ
jgi:hypothetical protein